MRQTFGDLVVHTPHTTSRMELPWTFSTFDYRELCRLLWEQCDAEFETAKVEGGAPVPTASHVVIDRPRRAQRAARRRRARLAAGPGRRRGYQPPDAPLSRGLEVHPWGASRRARDLDRPRLRARRLRLELPGPRRGAGRASARSTRATTSRSRPCGWPPTSTARPSATRATGSRTSSAPRPRRTSSSPATRPGHCLPLTAEGIRTALYFGIACGRELRRVVEGRATRDTALRRYSAFSADHEWQFEWMLRTQKAVPRVPPRLLAAALRWPLSSDAFVRWSFTHYLRIAHPSFALHGSAGTGADAERRRLASSGRSGRYPRAAARPRASAPT